MLTEDERKFCEHWLRTGTRPTLRDVQDLAGMALRLDAELGKAKAQNERYRTALIHILEYWNESENDTAMCDALHEMMGTADTALKETEAKP